MAHLVILTDCEMVGLFLLLDSITLSIFGNLRHSAASQAMDAATVDSENIFLPNDCLSVLGAHSLPMP